MGIGSAQRSKTKHVPMGGGFRAMWIDLLNTDGYRGRWVALDNVRYAGSSDEPLEADVVDVDDELAGLCARMRERGRTSCCVLHCAPRHSLGRHPARGSHDAPASDRASRISGVTIKSQA